jgi:glucosamine--fructose-6-phosphate aminotransferase (isomerizing)
MCGIVGILGARPVANELVDALRRLEYRGYDSAGVATVENGHLDRRRAEGKLRNLAERLAGDPLKGRAGIGHTRWATHGAPNEQNAHPHMTDKVSVVHNGIIENFRQIKEALAREGVAFSSETDTEVIAHLITSEMRKGADPVTATGRALKQLRGAFALAIIFAGHDDLMIGAREGSPLAVGHGENEMYLGWTPSRSRPSRSGSPISRKVTGSSSIAAAPSSATAATTRLNASPLRRRHPASWLTRATTSTSCSRRSTSSRK